MEDDRVAILEAQLSQAKLIAEESDKKYEEVKACPWRLTRNIATVYRASFKLSHSITIKQQ